MFLDERCYTYQLKDGYFEPLALNGRRSHPLSVFFDNVLSAAAQIPDAEFGLLYFEERYAPFVEEACLVLKGRTTPLCFPKSARLSMNLAITREEDEYVRNRLMSPGSGSGSGSNNNNNNNNGGSGSGSGSGSEGGCFGYGLDLI